MAFDLLEGIQSILKPIADDINSLLVGQPCHTLTLSLLTLIKKGVTRFPHWDLGSIKGLIITPV